MKIIGLFSGGKTAIGPKLSPTGIYKKPLAQVKVNNLGIVGDVQADTRVHGGPEKALHQFSLASYQKIIQRYPLLHLKAVPGSIGENLSSTTMHESSVCIGDIYSLGTCLLQVSSPRIPCWKIDAKFNQPGLSQFIAQHQLSGWYYRVLEEGKIQLGDEFSLVKRFNPLLTIKQFLCLTREQNLSEAHMQLVKNAEGLDHQWQKKLLKQ